MASLAPLRVIFLDVDGVICCNTSGVLETPKLLYLQKIVRATCAKVVLSTNWRYHADLKSRLIRVLGSFGIECIGDTPLIGDDGMQPYRPKEILAWLEAWNSSPGRPTVKQFVAVDDRLLLQEVGGEDLEGRSHLVQQCVSGPPSFLSLTRTTLQPPQRRLMSHVARHTSQVTLCIPMRRSASRHAWCAK